MQSGTYSKIYLAENDNKYFILKKMTNKNYNIFKNEISVHKKIYHKNAIEIVDIMEYDYFYYIVYPYCYSGDLFQYLMNNNKLSDQKTKYIGKQLGEVIKYLHNNRISHLDIKPENILIDDPYKLNIKLCDFGSSHISSLPYLQSKTNFITGTKNYVSPEQLNDRYSNYSDIWSYGVTMYTIKSGKLLFDNDICQMTDDKIKRKISNENFSSDFSNFLFQCIRISPYQRSNIHILLNHPWLNKN